VVRTKPPLDELLEPLPVVVDGVTVEPVWAAHARADSRVQADAAAHAVEVVDAVCARIVETRGLGALAPWLGPNSPTLEARPPTPPTTFSRIFELQPAHLGALPAWWEQNARNERVTIARRLALRAPRYAGHGVWTMLAVLRGPGQVRPVHMELSLWRHLSGWTKLTLEPRRRVYVKAFYFDAGHRVLDALCDGLVRDLVRAA
jgi:hypothetical protein